MSLKPLDRILDPTLTLPVTAEHVYVIQPVDARTGAWVNAIMGLAARVRLNIEGDEPSEADLTAIRLDTGGQEDMYQRVLGDVYQQLFDDGHSWEVVKFVGTTTVIWITQGKDAAEEFWNNGGQAPKAPKAPQDRKKPTAKKTPKA